MTYNILPSCTFPKVL